MMEQQYGRQVLAGEKSLQSCQKAIGRAGRNLWRGRLRALQICRNKFNTGKSLFLDAAKTQPLADADLCALEYQTSVKLAKLGPKARALIAAKCTDALLLELSPCATTVDAVVNAAGDDGCLIMGHAQEVAGMIDAEY